MRWVHSVFQLLRSRSKIVLLARPFFILFLLWCPYSFAITPQAQQQASEFNNIGVTVAKAGDFEGGVAFMKRALELNPADDQILTNLSGMLTEWARSLAVQSKTEEALTAYEEAVRYDSTNGIALFELGDLYYFRKSKFDHAILLWKKAHGYAPSSTRRMIADRISQAERDQRIERQFNRHQSEHFDVRVQSSKHPAVAALVEILEEEYQRLETQLGSGPPRITVIVYNDQDMKRLYHQRDWSVGFYDGRLRMRWNELVSGVARPLVAHELVHAFLHHLYGASVPTWVHEGFAQVNEGQRLMTEDEQRIEEGVRSRSMWIPLAWVDSRFTRPSDLDDVKRAYIESRVVVSELIKRHGYDRFKQFLGRLKDGKSLEMAFDQSFAPSRWFRFNQGSFD